MSAIRNVVFDIGRVLLDWQPDRLLAQRYADAALRARVRSAVFEHPDWHALDRGTLSDDDAIASFSARSGRPVDEMRELLEAVPRSLTPIAASVALVESLAQRGFKLYCLSNMGASTWRFVQSRDAFWRRFDGIVISAQVRLLKPEPAIYRHLLVTFSLQPGDTLFIDDTAANVAGARALGIHAIEFHDADDCRAEVERLLAG